MADPLFSIITPSCHAAAGLRETAESILRQDGSLEWIIFDKCSTDETPAVAAGLATDGRVRFHSEPDVGIYDAMNKGVRAARGRYLIFMGAADTLEPGILNAVERYLPHHNRALIYGDFICEGVLYGEQFTRRRMCAHNICHQAIFYGRDIFRLCGDYKLTYQSYADWAFNICCFARRDIKKIRVPLVIAKIARPGASAGGDIRFQRDKWALITAEYGRVGYWALRFLRPNFPFVDWPELNVKLRGKLSRLAGHRAISSG